MIIQDLYKKILILQQRYYLLNLPVCKYVLKPSQTSMMELFCDNSEQLKLQFFFFQKLSAKDVWLGYKHASDL